MSCSLPPIRGALPREETPSLASSSSASVSITSICKEIFGMESKVGRGANGEVTSLMLGGHLVAKKRTFKPLQAAERKFALALKEATSADYFRHLPRVYGVTKSSIVMELIPHAMQKPSAGDPPHFKLAHRVITGVCTALEDMKKMTGKVYVHRDIKLDNMRLREDGSVVLLDFGTLAIKGESGDDIQGTPTMIAHEGFCCLPIKETLDSWSLGTVVYSLLTGESHPIPALRGPFYNDMALICRSLMHYGIPLRAAAETPEAFIKDHDVDRKLMNWSQHDNFLREKIAELKDLADDEQDIETLDLMWGFLDPDHFTRLTPTQALERIQKGTGPELQSLRS